MRLRASSLVLAGVLVTSGGAFAVASTKAPGPATTAVTAAEPTPMPGADSTEPTTPPGQAKKDTTGERPGRGPHGQGPPGQAKKDTTGEHPGRGPDATGPAAYGLCRAWANQEDPAAKAERVPPFRNLAQAAGGVEHVEAYCASLPPRDDSDDSDD